ncbi:hypothetical protein WT49_15735 [Burkholderia territorii]|nr:hypothetical protein WS51_14705 [Burkholderia territorii]KVL34586.1 hypothetical protein WS97_17175 [Burkholderia territorii]KWA19576.1 hypothetical protein WT37_11300 [Burkholderia territorii]KWE34125.1 hypothetical protein WT49_15735 [Burkholderia territorii]KWE44894.1 hypothetical protein WT50_09185 [Burkholderia territorii]
MKAFAGSAWIACAPQQTIGQIFDINEAATSGDACERKWNSLVDRFHQPQKIRTDASAVDQWRSHNDDFETLRFPEFADLQFGLEF